ncbi:ribonuclease H-like domain-containing protein [Tanacetum coccineum]
MDINWQIAMIAIRMNKLYKKTRRRVHMDGKTPVGFDKKKLECFNCHNTSHFARECTANGTHDGKKRKDSFYQHQEARKQEKNQMGLLTMDDGIVNWGEHNEDEETNHALMAISSSSKVSLCSRTCIDSYNTLKTLCDEQMNQLGDQEAQILAYSQAVKKLEAQLVTFQKQQLSLNEKLTFQANEIYEKDEDVELIVEPSAIKITEEKVESRTSSKNSKKEEILTEPQQEKKASSTDTSEDNPKIIAFRRELEEIALKHLGTVSENNSTSTPSVNTGRLDYDDSPMPELEIFHKFETGIFDEASYDEEGVITDFNSLPIEIKVSPTHTLMIHNIHLKSQILGDPKSTVQTRSKVQQKSGAHALFSFQYSKNSKETITKINSIVCLHVFYLKRNLKRLLKLYKMTVGFKPCKKNCYNSSYNKYGFL